MKSAGNGGRRFDLAPTWREIAPGVALTGEVPRRTSFEPGDQTLKYYDDAGSIVVDPIRDDQTVVIDTPDGLFVVLGCSHAGLITSSPISPSKRASPAFTP